MPTALKPENVRLLDQIGAAAEDAIREAGGSDRATLLVEHGRSVAVLMSPALYRELLDATERLELIEALELGEADIAAGRTVPHAHVVDFVRSWTNRPE